MGTVKFGLGDLSGATAGDFKPYTGKPPGRGCYRTKMKNLHLVKNRNDDWMLKAVFVVDVPKGHKYERFNGYPAWGQQNITEQGAGFVNDMICAMVGPDEAKQKEVLQRFWAVGPRVEEGAKKDKPKILAIGKLKIDPKGMTVWCILDQERDNKNRLVARPAAYLTPAEGEDPSDHDAEFEPDDSGVEEEYDESYDEDDFDGESEGGVEEETDAEESEDDDDSDDEADDESDDEGDDEDDEEEEDGDEEGDEDPEDARRNELGSLQRIELVRVAKSVGIKRTKGVLDEKLIDSIIEIEIESGSLGGDDNSDEPPF